MLRTRSKRQATAAEQELTVIQASIAALAGEELLDLAGILPGHAAPPVAEMASAEMLSGTSSFKPLDAKGQASLSSRAAQVGSQAG